MLIRLFDDLGQGYITVQRFREILREIDNTISQEELDGIISDVSINIKKIWLIRHLNYFKVDTDNSNTIDFDEFVNLMT